MTSSASKKAMKRNAYFWLSYDLGINGDYESIYYWLDYHKARECGDSIAFISEYEYKDDFVKFLKNDLSESISIDKRTRIYVIFKNEKNNMKGKFVFGNRKRSPWAGSALSEEQAADEIE